MNISTAARVKHENIFVIMRKARVCLGACLLVSFALNPLSAQVTQGASETKGLGKADQEKKNDEVIELSPYVVSSAADEGYAARQTLIGGRTASNPLTIATSIQIINEELLHDLSAETMMDALRYGTSGVSYNQKQTEDMMIRGFRTVQTLRDGLTKFNFRAQPMYDVERLEVIKGPTAMLLGTSYDSNLGGVVNAISRMPTATRQAQLETTLGEHNDYRVNLNLSGPVMRYEGGELQYRLTIGGQKSDGTRQNENIDQEFIGAALKWFIGKNQSISAVGHLFKDNSYSYFDDFLDISQPVPAEAKLNTYSTDSFAYARRGDAYMHDMEKYLSVTYLAKVGENVDLKANFTTVNNIAQNLLVQGSTLAVDNYTVGRNALPQRLEANVQNVRVDYQHRINLPKETNLILNAGIDVSLRKQRNALSIVPLAPLDARNPNYSADAAIFSDPTKLPGITGSGFNNSDSTQFPTFAGYFFQPQLNFWKDRIIFTYGKRWLHDTGTSRNNRTNIDSRRITRTVPTEKYGALVRIFPWLSGYYTYAQNFLPRSGTLRTPYLTDPGELLKDQSGELKEFGLKFDKKISGSLTAFGSLASFDQYLTNVITSAIDPVSGALLRGDGTGYKIQSEKDRAKGIETDLGLRLKSAGGYADVIATYYNADSKTALGTPVNGAPKIVFSLLGKYTWTAGPLDGFMIGIGGYEASRKPFAGSRYVDTPTTYNTFLAYTWRQHWSVQINLDNLTNERFVLNSGSPTNVVAIEPFSGRVGIRYKW
jgi:iron complex outermembrane recepter protein